MNRFIGTCRALLLTAATVFACSAQAQSFYATMPRPDNYAGLLFATLNNEGQMVGWAYGKYEYKHWFLTGPDALGLTELPYAVKALNDSGQLLLGDSITGPNGAGLISLGTLGGELTSGTVLNNAGQVAGTSTTADGTQHVFLTGPNGSHMNDLGTIPGAVFSDVIDLNEEGQIIGRAYMADGSMKSFTGDASGLRSLDWVDDLGYVQAINDRGQLLGNGFDGHAFTATIAGDSFAALAFDGVAQGFNNAGQIIGTRGTSKLYGGDRYAWVTGAGGEGFYDLNVETEVDPLVHVANIFWIPMGINERGQIAVMDYSKRTFLVSPVPEPQSLSMALLGVAVISGIGALRARVRAKRLQQKPMGYRQR